MAAGGCTAAGGCCCCAEEGAADPATLDANRTDGVAALGWGGPAMMLCLGAR